MESELIGKLVPNAVSAVAVIVVVWMFLKSQKESRDSSVVERQEFIKSVRQIRDECHVTNEQTQKGFQAQVAQASDEYIRLADSYNKAMQTFAQAIGANGEILNRMEILMKLDRRGEGRRSSDWQSQEESK